MQARYKSPDKYLQFSRVHRCCLVKPDVCNKHGAYENKCFIDDADGNHVWLGCDKCNNDRQLSTVNEHAPATPTEKFLNSIECSDIPSYLFKTTFDSFLSITEEHKTILNDILSYCDRVLAGNAPNLLIIGKSGAGKSHIAAGAAWKIKELGGSVFFINEVELFRKISECKDRGSKIKESDFISAMVSCDALFIDDLGASHMNNSFASLLYEITDKRSLSKKPMIFTSNLQKESLYSHFGERASDRLRRGFGVKVISMNFESYSKINRNNIVGIH